MGEYDGETEELGEETGTRGAWRLKTNQTNWSDNSYKKRKPH